MSAFDKRVLLWLDGSTLSTKSKLTMLNRVSMGINTYRDTPLDQAGNGHKLEVDYGVEDSISKAVRKLESGEEVPKGGLFPNLKVAPRARTPIGSRRATPRIVSGRSTAAGGSATRSRQSAASSPTSKSPAATPKNNKRDDASNSGDSRSAQGGGGGAGPFAAFSFGDSAPAPEEDNNETGPADDEMNDAEDRKRRRMTLTKRASRNAISAEVVRQDEQDDFDAQETPKPADITRRIVKTLEKHHLFMHLDDKDLHYVADIMTLRSVKKGEKLVTQGKENGTFSVIVTGSCIIKTKQNAKLNIGACVGELGLMYDNKSEETVEAAMAMTQVAQLSRRAYQIVCARASQAKRARYEGFLSRVKFLSGLEPSELLQLADSLKEASYKKGDYLIKYGQPGEWFSIILEGVVTVIGRNEAKEEVEVCTFKEGDCVGELEFLFKHDTVADVVATTDHVKTAKMTTFHFEKVIGSAKEVLERKANDDEVYGYYRQKKEEMDKK